MFSNDIGTLRKIFSSSGWVIGSWVIQLWVTLFSIILFCYQIMCGGCFSCTVKDMLSLRFWLCIWNEGPFCFFNWPNHDTLIGQETACVNRTRKAFVYLALCVFIVDRCEYVNSKWCSIVITPKIKSLRYFNKIKLCTSFVSSVVFNGLKICWMMKAQKLWIKSWRYSLGLIIWGIPWYHTFSLLCFETVYFWKFYLLFIFKDDNRIIIF